MFAADTELQVVSRAPAALGGDADELAHAVEIQLHERIPLDDTLLDIGRQEGRGVVARDTEGGLCQVVGAEGEEFGGFGDDMGAQARAAARSSCR